MNLWKPLVNAPDLKLLTEYLARVLPWPAIDPWECISKAEGLQERFNDAVGGSEIEPTPIPVDDMDGHEKGLDLLY